MLTPRILLRSEGLAALTLSLIAYVQVNGSWLWFAILFFSPDLSMAGYVKDKRVGGAVYNLVHTYVGPG